MKCIFTSVDVLKVLCYLCRNKKTMLCLSGILSFGLSYGQVAARWTFETSQPTTAGPYDAEVGTGQVTCFHANGASAYTNPTGNGSAESYSIDNWTDGDWYQFHTSTLGLPDVVFAFDQTSSSTGPKSFFIQVSIDGAIFTSLAGTNYNVGNDTWVATASGYVAASHHSFALPGLQNRPDIYVRIKLATGSTAVNGGAIAVAGTSRIDNASIGSANVVLPVLITDFTLRDFPGENLLEWKTAMEKDMDYFSVEKSGNGKSFKEIAQIKVHNDIHGSAYQFDDKVATENVCYRLKSFGVNGESEISRIVYSKGYKAKGNVSCPYNILVNNQPLLLNIGDNKLDYWIIGNDGKMLAHAENTQDGLRTVSVSFDHYPAGIYFLKTLSNGEEQVFKIVKL